MHQIKIRSDILSCFPIIISDEFVHQRLVFLLAHTRIPEKLCKQVSAQLPKFSVQRRDISLLKNTLYAVIHKKADVRTEHLEIGKGCRKIGKVRRIIPYIKVVAYFRPFLKILRKLSLTTPVRGITVIQRMTEARLDVAEPNVTSSCGTVTSGACLLKR